MMNYTLKLKLNTQGRRDLCGKNLIWLAQLIYKNVLLPWYVYGCDGDHLQFQAVNNLLC